MKITININVGVELTEKEAMTLLTQLFRDAFGEFTNARCNDDAEAYVNLRYPEENYPWLDRAKKVVHVAKRYALAQSLKEAAGDLR